MNVYTIAPLIAVVAYIPLILTLIGSRPWQKRHSLFLVFIISAMIWSITDIFLRSNYFPDHKYLFFQLIVITYMLMAVCFHQFTSSFFGTGYGRWLPFAYGSLAVVTVLVAFGIIPESASHDQGGVTIIHYGMGILFVFVPLIVIVTRNYYVFIKMLRSSNNPISNNQLMTLMLAIGVLTLLTIASFLPAGKSFPISHYGNLINAFILTYAVIKHQLIDIKLILRKGTTWVLLAMVGISLFWLLLIGLKIAFNFQLDVTGSLAATAIGVLVSILIYNIRDQVFGLMSRAFQGSSYDYHQRLSDFTNKIHNVFSLKEQGGELLILLLRAVNIKYACLLFPESGSNDFLTQYYEPKSEGNHLGNLKLRANNPIIKYLEREQKILTKENLDILPAFLSLWPQEREEIGAKNIALFVPLISRDRLIAILVLGEKAHGRYSLEDVNIIENVTGRVAVSMEKEFLREQLREREEELSVINTSSVILSSSLDIQEIFIPFIDELKKVVDVNWASIVLIEDENLHCVALSSPENSAYQIGERVPMEGTGTGWVLTQKKPFIESDLAQERYFNTSEHFYAVGLRTLGYIPLIAKGRVIGSFIVGSKAPNAYSQRHIKLLEQLASQIAMPLENTLLYAKAEKKARIDELTRLYNRRSLDEMLDSEISRHSRYGGTFSLAIIDLDSFKTYNDTYGHLAGDGLLQDVGRSIRAAIRTSDYPFRYGGDEFAILLPQTAMDAALQVVERVRKKIAENLHTDKVPVSASIGLASWPDHGISHTDIIASADVTLYRAKRNGGNQCLCASGPLDLSSSSEAEPGEEKNFISKLNMIIRAFSETIDSRSYYTNHHSKKVMDYAVALAKELELSAADVKTVEYAALLHDAGKVAMDNTIIDKPGKLTDAEWAKMKTHPRIGADIAGIFPQTAPCVGAILHHHEKYDGTGYPDGLKGDAIPLASRILAIANAFATMTMERSYSKTMTMEDALAEIKRSAGTQFDPALVEKFAAIFSQQDQKTKKNANGKTI